MKQKLIALAVATMLVGCSTATMKPIKEGVAKDDAKATAALDALRKFEPLEEAPKKSTQVKHVKSVWMPVKKVENEYSEIANAHLARQVAVDHRRFVSLNEATSYITALTGIPATSSVLQTGTSVNGISQSNQAQVPGMMPASVNGQFTNQQNQNIWLAVYNGKLSGFLDLIAARYNISWEWDGAGVRFFKTKSKTYRITALPGNTSLKSKIGTQSSGSGASNGSSSGAAANTNAEQEAGTEFSGLSVWTGIEDSIKTMLTADGKITVTPSTGTITVTDVPAVLNRVSTFVDDQNKALARQVVINVKVLSVDLSDSDEYGINWNAVYQNVNRNLGFSLSNIAQPTVGATNMTLSVLSGTNWDGTTAMIDALSKQGKVSQVTSASLVTLNNQPAPIQVARQTAYLASSQTTLGTAGTGNTTTLQPGKITTGFSMNMIPHILDNNKLMLQYSGDISSLIRIGQVSSGGSTIQTPEVDTRNFLQRVIMNGGETLVVTGFEQFNLSGNTQGVGSADNLALGGQVMTKKGKNVLVVLIQPVMSGK
jgi:type IVB pilus formation R64 PilN family outer membrane protein